MRSAAVIISERKHETKVMIISKRPTIKDASRNDAERAQCLIGTRALGVDWYAACRGRVAVGVKCRRYTECERSVVIGGLDEEEIERFECVHCDWNLSGWIAGRARG